MVFIFTCFSPSDLYISIQGELEHRRVKRFYVRSNKNKYARQCARHERRERMLSKRKVRNAKGKAKAQEKTASVAAAPLEASPALAFADSDKLPFTSPKVHHHISESNRFKQDIPTWLNANAGDPALKVFITFFSFTSIHLLEILITGFSAMSQRPSSVPPA